MKKLLWAMFAFGVMGTTSGCVVDDTYAVCSSTRDCRDIDDMCWGVTVGPAGTSGNFCSHTCVNDSNCERNFGFSGACYSIERTEFLCYQRCEFNSDCYLSSVCIQLNLTTGGVDFICVPDN